MVRTSVYMYKELVTRGGTCSDQRMHNYNDCIYSLVMFMHVLVPVTCCMHT